MQDQTKPILERSVLMGIVFSFVTFGIYSLYWIYKLQDETCRLFARRNEASPALVVALSIVTIGIYTVWWAYHMGLRFRDEARERGSSEADDCPTLYLVLQLFNYLIGISFIANLALMQDRFNNVLRRRGMGRRPYDPNRFNRVPEAEIARRAEQREEEYNASLPDPDDL